MTALSYERRGDGPPLVLVHATGSQWQAWEPVFELLSAERDVIAVDLPGFGGSAPLAGEPAVGPERYAAVLGAFLDELDLGPVHAAGNSVGGAVALELARIRRACSVTAIAPIGFWNHREAEFCRFSVLASQAAVRALSPLLELITRPVVTRTILFAQPVARPWRIDPDEALGAARNLARSPGIRAALDGYRHWRFGRPDEIGCPVTIAWPERDRLLLPRQALRARRVLPGAHHLTLRGCGHVPTWDDPEQVALVLLEGSAL